MARAHWFAFLPTIGFSVVLSVIGVQPSAHAAVETWSGAIGTDWNSVGNWSGANPIPVNGDSLVFDASSAQLTSNNNIASLSLSGLTFASGAPGYSLTGNAITLTGPLVVNAANAIPQTVDFGVTSSAALTFGADSSGSNSLALNSTSSFGSLVVSSNSATPNNLAIGPAGQTLTINGPVTVGGYDPANAAAQSRLTFTAGDKLVVNAGTGSLLVGGNSAGTAGLTASLDLSTVANFEFTGAEFNLGGRQANGTGNRSNGTVTLANTANTIKVTSLNVGAGSNSNAGSQNFFNLGAGTNTIQTNSLFLGTFKSTGTIQFASAAGSLSIRNNAGTGRAAITIGSHQSSGTVAAKGNLLLNGHSVDILASTMIVGQITSATTNATVANQVLYDTGVVDVTSIVLAQKTGSATGTVNSTWTMGGGNLVVNSPAGPGTGTFVIGNNASSNATGTANGIFNLNAGTATVHTNITLGTATGTATINLQGATLDMTARSIGTFALPITTLNLQSGNLNNVTTLAGKDITLGGGLAIGGAAPTFVLPGAGTLNSSLAPLTLGAGGGIRGGTSTPASISGDVVVNSGAIVSPGFGSATGILAFNSPLSFTNGSTARIKLSENIGSDNDQINANAGLSLSGTVNIEIGSAGLGPQIGNTYTLMTYGASLTGNEANINIIGNGSRTTFSVIPTSISPFGTVQVSVGGTAPLALTWIGNSSTTWDLNAVNWQTPALVADKFFQLDAVTFDNTSTNLGDVTLIGQLSPSAVTVNATRNYKFVGTGGLAGGGALTKSNTGTLVIATNNSNTGVTDIQAGLLQVGDGGTSGSLGTGNITNEGILAFNRSDALTVANIISGSGAVRQDGTGTLTLSGANTFAGSLIVNAGAVNLIVAGSAGTGTTTVNPGGTLVAGVALTTPLVLAGGKFGTNLGATFSAGEVTAATGTTSTIYTADPLNLGTNTEAILTGTLRGSGNINVQSGTAAINPDGNPGFRLRGTGASDFSGTITLGNNVKGEIQTDQAGPFSPAGTGKFLLTAGDAALGNTQTAATTTGGYSEFNVRNNSTGNTTFGNDVEIVGTGLALMNPLGSSPVNAVTTMGNLKIGGGQELGVFLNSGNTHVIEFPTVTLNGGTSTFSPKTPGFGPVASVGSDIALGNVTQLVAGSGIAMSGLRTLYINGTTSYTGPTQVNSGTLGGIGTINSPLTVGAAGSLNPGYLPSPIGTLTATSVSLAGTLSIDLNDGDLGIQDVLNVTNALSLTNATLKLNITGALSAPAYIISHYGSLTGGPFAAFEGTPGNYKVDYNYLNGNQIALVPAAALVQGDFNRNGALDAGDLSAMLKALTNLSLYKSQNSLSEQNLLAIGDFNASTSVTNQDLQPLVNLLAQNNLGSVAAVPEPTGLVLGAMALAGVAFTARRRKLQQN